MAEITITREQMLTGIIKPDKAQPIEWERISGNLRWWIGGSHDSDGCTTVDYKHGPRVMVVKAENGYGSLEALKMMLGGSIHKHAPETEDQQEKKCWTLSGRSAVDFCVNMKHFLFLKRPQLVKMSEYPIDDLQLMQLAPVTGTNIVDGSVMIAPSMSEAARRLGKKPNNIHVVLDNPNRSSYGYKWRRITNPVQKESTQKKCRDIENELREMKHLDHAEIPGDLPLPYVAGMIDGDGCVTLLHDSVYPSVSVGQKYVAICDALKFNFGGSVRYREQRGFSSYTWDLKAREHAIRLLESILPYLIEKNTQTQLALSMRSTSEPDKVRKQFQKTKGRQGENMRKKLLDRLLL